MTEKRVAELLNAAQRERAAHDAVIRRAGERQALSSLQQEAEQNDQDPSYSWPANGLEKGYEVRVGAHWHKVKDVTHGSSGIRVQFESGEEVIPADEESGEDELFYLGPDMVEVRGWKDEFPTTDAELVEDWLKARADLDKLLGG